MKLKLKIGLICILFSFQSTYSMNFLRRLNPFKRLFETGIKKPNLTLPTQKKPQTHVQPANPQPIQNRSSGTSSDWVIPAVAVGTALHLQNAAHQRQMQAEHDEELARQKREHEEQLAQEHHRHEQELRQEKDSHANSNTHSSFDNSSPDNESSIDIDSGSGGDGGSSYDGSSGGSD